MEVSMERDMQSGNRVTSPTWEQWRWELDTLGSTMRTEDARSRRRRRRVEPERPVNVTQFKECAHFSSPSRNQLSEQLDLEMIYQPMLLADHIYCLCVQCDLPKFPRNWAGKVSMLDVIEADKCLEQQNLSHSRKATTMHKLVVWAAKAQGFRTAMVLEQDFVLPDSKTRAYIHIDYKALDTFILRGSWDFLRFGFMPWKYEAKDGGCKPECFCVREPLSKDVCTTEIGCDVRSAVAYMVAVRQPIVDSFLNSTGVVDMFILQGFKQSYVVPAVIHQSSGYYVTEVQNDASYRAICWKGKQT